MNQAILAQFRPAQQELLRERLLRFGTISRFVGGDFNMPVELNPPGAGWHWNFAANHVAFDAQELLDFPEGAVRAIAAHEGAHRRILTPQCLPADLVTEPGFMFMTNAVEDCRGNNFTLAYYPAFEKDSEDLYGKTVRWDAGLSQKAEMELGFAPRHIQAGLEYIRAWYCDSRALKYETPQSIMPEVKECLRRTLAASRRSARLFPSMEECESDAGRVEGYCRASTQINLSEIWPEFKKLAALDLEEGAVQSMLQDMFGKKGGAESRLRQGELRGKLTDAEGRELDKAVESGKQRGASSGRPDFAVPLDGLPPALRQRLRDFFKGLPPKERAEHEEKAKRMLEGVSREFLDLDFGGDDGGPLVPAMPKESRQKEQPSPSGESQRADAKASNERAVQPQTSKEPGNRRPVPLIQIPCSTETGLRQDYYESYRQEMKSLITRLKASLEAALSANEPGRFQEGLRSGTSFSVSRRMREIAQNVQPCDSRAFRRRCENEEKNYAFFLLVDLSASMCGSKVEQAAKAAVVFCEALESLSLPFAVAGYHSGYFPLKDAAQPLDACSRERIGSLQSLAGGTTDTGWAVEKAMAVLMEVEAAQKVMIVLTDGAEEPSSAHSAEQQRLPAVLNRLRRRYACEAPIVIGLGLGSGTAEVARAFPNHLAEIDAADLPKRFSKLLEDVISRAELYQ